MTIQRLLTLPGHDETAQIISLMTFDGADNTFAMGDHADHIHVGWRPLSRREQGSRPKQIDAILKPKQWIKQIDRLGEIDNPTVRSTRASTRSSQARRPTEARSGAPAAPRLESGPMSTADTKAQIERRSRTSAPGPGAGALKLVFELELRGRGDIQLSASRSPAEDHAGHRLRREGPPLHPAHGVQRARPRTARSATGGSAFESGHVKASGPPRSSS
jgi:hypothetical protein